MNIKIPETLKTSDKTGKLSRTIKGLAVVAAMVIIKYTPLTQAETIEVINLVLMGAGIGYTIYGVAMKLYNKYYKKQK